MVPLPSPPQGESPQLSHVSRVFRRGIPSATARAAHSHQAVFPLRLLRKVLQATRHLFAAHRQQTSRVFHASNRVFLRSPGLWSRLFSAIAFKASQSETFGSEKGQKIRRIQMPDLSRDIHVRLASHPNRAFRRQDKMHSMRKKRLFPE